MTKNVYIHIPFCKSKCKYCSFVSFPRIELKNKYIKALIQEIKTNYKNETLNTLYIGGGTPSILSTEDFKSIISLFKTNLDTEITTELNPETITLEYLQNLKEIGINRLSSGCQTFNNKILKIIGRRHNSKDVENAINYAKDANFKNISLDLIYGLPEQNIKEFEKDIKHAISLGINHISLYGLKIDDNCYFYNHMPENLPNEDTQAEMYLKAIEITKQNNFEHYEISNFAQKGYESSHNLNYWNNNTYYGFGVASHGYENGVRYYNTSNLEEYINNPTIHKSSHKLTIQEQLEEEIFLGFRKSEGINIEKINSKFNIDFLKKYSEPIKKYTFYKYLIETNVGFKLSNNGFLISNIILADFIE